MKISARTLGVADSSSLILKALTRAASQPQGLLLFAGKTEDGLFPNTSAGKAAARKTLEEGLLHVNRTESVGRTVKEYASLTVAGAEWLQAEGDPKAVLEDFVRVLEAREDQITQLVRTSQELAQSIAAMKETLAGILPQALAARVATTQRNGVNHYAGVSNSQATSAGVSQAEDQEELDEAILTHLADWTGSAAAGQDCPLPELFRALGLREHPPSIGQFHDSLRRLHEEQRLYLHPWTGPLYALPEPSYAMLIGHNIAFYASPRR